MLAGDREGGRTRGCPAVRVCAWRWGSHPAAHPLQIAARVHACAAQGRRDDAGELYAYAGPVLNDAGERHDDSALR
eukprot:COSAG06_NODE_4325_length_4365_cov_2.112518_3_plen_76_part_00